MTEGEGRYMSPVLGEMEMAEATIDWFKSSGKVDGYRKKLKERIQLVLDSTSGKRRVRNLWGLRPVRSQRLMAWYEDDGLRLSHGKLGGKRFSFGRHAAEDLVESVADDYGLCDFVGSDTSETEEPVFKDVLAYISSQGIQFRRTAYLERGDFNPLMSVVWDVSKIDQSTKTQK